jgi:hypothetical protein
VPQLLQNEQKQHRLEVSRELQHQLQEDPNFLSKVVTGSIRLLFLLQDENQVEGARFDTVKEIQVDTQIVLSTLTNKHFQHAFQKWQKHRDWCVRSQEDYFEGGGAE